MLSGSLSQHNYSSKDSGDPSTWHTCRRQSSDGIWEVCCSHILYRFCCILKVTLPFQPLTQSRNRITTSDSVIGFHAFKLQIYRESLWLKTNVLLAPQSRDHSEPLAWSLKDSCTWLEEFSYCICSLKAHNLALIASCMNVSTPSCPIKIQTLLIQL